MIYIENKRRKIKKNREQYPEADILDITSSSTARYARMLSPFYPHGNIPIPLESRGIKATCVEAIWQGLKVFDSEDVSFSTFKNDTMKNLKRTVRKFGVSKGHRNGAYGDKLLNYFDARMKIYLPAYKWVLDNVAEVHDIVKRIAERAKKHDIVFLDYNTNEDFRDISSPLSHAGLVKLYIEGTYPDANEDYKPLTDKERKEKEISSKGSKEVKNN